MNRLCTAFFVCHPGFVTSADTLARKKIDWCELFELGAKRVDRWQGCGIGALQASVQGQHQTWYNQTAGWRKCNRKRRLGALQ